MPEERAHTGGPEAQTSAGRPSFEQRVLAAVGIAATVAILIALTWYARHVLLLAFAGLLVAVFLRHLATSVSRVFSISPRWALVLVVTALAGALTGAFALRGAAIAREVQTLGDELPRAANSLRNRLQNVEWGQRLIDATAERLQSLPNEENLVGRVTGAASRTLGILTSIAFVLFLGVVVAATPHIYRNGLLALVPKDRLPRARAVILRLYDVLWWWLIGRIISMSVVGIATGIGLWLLGIPLAFVLGLIAALLTFIPNIGPVLSALPAVLLALLQGPRTALWVVMLYIGVQLVESWALAPIIDRKTVYLPPGLTIFAQLLLALIGGLLGLTLATPLAATIVVLVTMVYVQDVLGRHDVHLQSH